MDVDLREVLSASAVIRPLKGRRRRCAFCQSKTSAEFFFTAWSDAPEGAREPVEVAMPAHGACAFAWLDSQPLRFHAQLLATQHASLSEVWDGYPREWHSFHDEGLDLTDPRLD